MRLTLAIMLAIATPLTTAETATGELGITINLSQTVTVSTGSPAPAECTAYPAVDAQGNHLTVVEC